MKAAIITGIVVLFLATSATAQNTAPGPSLKAGKWAEMCTSQQQLGILACTSYAIGLYDGLILWKANSEDPIKICIPEHSFISAKQVIDIGLDYIKRYPDKGTRAIAVVLMEAIEEAFPIPCKEM
jgi:hypothetical protein